jgi:hypothetical protein
VVVTLYNEVAALEELYDRMVTTLDGFGRSFELIFVDDPICGQTARFVFSTSHLPIVGLMP